MIYVYFVVAVISLAFIITAVTSIKNGRKLKKRLRESYGKIPDRKYGEYDMESIGSYWELRREAEKPLHAVDSTTWEDLSMDDVYKRINTTCSSIGDEYLYSELHEQAYDAEKLDKLENAVQYFGSHPDVRLRVQFLLSRIGRVTSNGLPEFLFHPEMQKLNYGFIYPVLAAAAAGSLLLTILNAHIFAPFLILIILMNIIVYQKTKHGLEAELISMWYISSLMLGVRKICSLKAEEFSSFTEKLSASYAPLRKIGGFSGSILSKSSSDVDFLVEYVRMFFMIDFILYNLVIGSLIKHGKQFNEIYRTVGFMETAISVASYRESVQFYTKPEFVGSDEIILENIVHPLLKKPVPNTVAFKRSVLVTGSNASGKSTFVKAVAVNAILAQTIHTCLAARFCMKPSFVVTSTIYIAQRTPKMYLGTANSLLAMINGLGFAIGPVIMGNILSAVHYREAWLIVSVLILLGSLYMLMLNKKDSAAS